MLRKNISPYTSLPVLVMFALAVFSVLYNEYQANQSSRPYPGLVAINQYKGPVMINRREHFRDNLDPIYVIEKTSYTVNNGDSFWSIISGLVEQRGKAFEEESRTIISDAIKDAYKRLSVQDMRRMGVASGDLNKLQPGENIDLSTIYGNGTKLASIIGKERVAMLKYTHSPSYEKDTNFVYWKKEKREDIDLKTFIVMDHDYVKDRFAVYSYTGKRLNVLNPASFEVLNFIYQKDRSKVYYQGAIIPSSHLSSFQIIKDQYAKDCYNVYEQGRPMDSADPDSFVLLENGYSKDKKQVYWSGKVISGADPYSFRVVNRYSGTVHLSTAEDKNHNYSYGKVNENQ